MKIEDFFNQIMPELGRFRTGDGGFTLVAGSEARPDATAWGLLALRFMRADAREIRRSAARLQGWQDSTGGMISKLQDYAVIWPTALAVLAWSGIPEASEARRKAVDFLLNTAVGKTWKKATGVRYGDPDTAGWPWNNNTYSWVAPTAMSMIALKAGGLKNNTRYGGAVQMLLQRQLPSGGWNYGNTVVFDSELLPLPDITGMALCALAGEVGEEEIRVSLAYLQKIMPSLDSPSALGWGILALKAWSRDYPPVERAAAAAARAASLKVLTCEWAGLLAMAVAVQRNLVLSLQTDKLDGMK